MNKTIDLRIHITDKEDTEGDESEEEAFEHWYDLGERYVPVDECEILNSDDDGTVAVMADTFEPRDGWDVSENDRHETEYAMGWWAESLEVVNRSEVFGE